MNNSMLRLLAYLLPAAAIALAADDLPRVDLHVHIHDDENPAKSLTPADAAALSKKMGVRFGVLGEGGCSGDIHDNATLSTFLAGFGGLPLWRGMQVYGFEWRRCLSKENLDRLDYIAADALVFPDRGGKSVRLWLPGVQFADAQDFMERYVEYNVKVLSQQVQVWANPTYLPESLQARYAELWTPARMERVIRAAVKGGIAIEINSRFRIPSAAFVRKAKADGAKFSFGSNRHVHGIGDIEYCLETARACGLTKRDIFLPAKR
jgi:hypothetical protein